ncbi:hypothetical protein [Demequina sp. NBRC 110051]|uniref:hypothetical protein n=1 Tax=Demequina sp. NBRC 110051 TaxID=1570340 RepID=UPI000A00A26E|nr:hypothetical protein [Demequina sp. NBRC 110051]
MSEHLSRGLTALIDDEAQAFSDTRLGADPTEGLVAVSRARRRRAVTLAASSMSAVAAIAVGATLWSGAGATEAEPASSSLLTTATSRSQTDPETRDDTQAAMRCTWAAGDGPRDTASGVDGEPAYAIVMDECDAVWVGQAPLVDASMDLTFDGNSTSTATVDAHWTVTNVSDLPLEVDAAAIAPAFEIPDLRTDTLGGNDGIALVAKDLWITDSERFTLLTSDAGTVTLGPGDALEGTTILNGDEYVTALRTGAPHRDYLRIPLAYDGTESLILEVPTGELTESEVEGAA